MKSNTSVQEKFMTLVVLIWDRLAGDSQRRNSNVLILIFYPSLAAFYFIVNFSREDNPHGIESSLLLLIMLAAFVSLGEILNRRKLNSTKQEEWLYVRGVSRMQIAFCRLLVAGVRAGLMTLVIMCWMGIIKAFCSPTGFLDSFPSVQALFVSIEGWGLGWALFSFTFLTVISSHLFHLSPLGRLIPAKFEWSLFRRFHYLIRFSYLFAIIPGIFIWLVLQIHFHFIVYLFLSPVLVTVFSGIFICMLSKQELDVAEPENNRHAKTSETRKKGLKPFSVPYHPAVGLFWNGIHWTPILFAVIGLAACSAMIFVPAVQLQTQDVSNFLFELGTALTMFIVFMLLPYIYKIFAWNLNDRTGQYLFQTGQSLGELLRHRQLFVLFTCLLPILLFQIVGFEPFRWPSLMGMYAIVTVIALVQTAPHPILQTIGVLLGHGFIWSFLIFNLVLILSGVDLTFVMDLIQLIMSRLYLYILPIPFLLFSIIFLCTFREQWLREQFINKWEK